MIPLEFVGSHHFQAWFDGLTDEEQNFVKATGHDNTAGNVIHFFHQGNLSKAAVMINMEKPFESSGDLQAKLQASQYKVQAFDKNIGAPEWKKLYLYYLMGTYAFDTFKKSSEQKISIEWPRHFERKSAEAIQEGIFLTRDLVNMPTNHMGPADLSVAMKKLADDHGASFTDHNDQDFVQKEFPLVYAVGKAGPQSPRLLELKWGDESQKKVCLVGKGVCFDTGGLNIKPTGAMKLMKKDMGGAAHVLGLAKAIMGNELPIHLHVIVPAVENSISSNAFRPLDIYKSRKGLTVEIGHTDAEGRLILADALTYASEHKPDIIIDFATLTGAARIATGFEIQPFMSTHKEYADALHSHSELEDDPLWELPLHAPYREYLNSKNADINNEARLPHGGAITAGLFLKEFVDESIPWIHLDVHAYNMYSRPGRPEGGEAVGLRAVFELIRDSFV